MKLAGHHLQSLLAVRPLDRIYAGSTVGNDSEVLVRQLLPGLPAAERRETSRVFVEHMARLERLTQPGTLPVREFCRAETGPFYFVTDMPVGVTLAELVRATGSLEVPVSASIGAAIADRLSHAHEHGVLHLAIHSGQALIAPDGRVTLLDLGLVPLLLDRVQGRLRRVHTAWDFLFPEPGAVAPELLAGEVVGPATDVYGLGVLLYFMATAVMPYDGSSVVAFNAILSGRQDMDPRRHMPELEPEFSKLVARCLHRDPSQRPRSAREVAGALRTWAAPLDEALVPYASVISPRRFVERFEPLLRVVDGGRGRDVEPEPTSPAVVPLFVEHGRALTEPELLAHMSAEQRRIYLLGAAGAEARPSRRAEWRRGALLGVALAIVAVAFLPFLQPSLDGVRGGHPAALEVVAPPEPAPMRLFLEARPPATERHRAMYRRGLEERPPASLQVPALSPSRRRSEGPGLR